MSPVTAMREALSRAAEEGRVLRRWEMTEAAWNAISRELDPDVPPSPLTGHAAPRPLFGAPVAIIPGDRVIWNLIVDERA